MAQDMPGQPRTRRRSAITADGSTPTRGLAWVTPPGRSAQPRSGGRVGRWRASLILTAALALGAGAAVAQVMNHDAPVQKIMAAETNPGALAFWAGGNDPPEDESKAEAKARWDEAVKGARLLQTSGEALRKHSRGIAWNAFSDLMIATGREGEAAAKAKDAAKAFEIGGRVYDSCNGCHKTYIPSPPREAPPP